MFSTIKLIGRLFRPAVFSSVMLFIAVMLQLFLLLSCSGPSGVYTGMHIVSFNSISSSLSGTLSNSTQIINSTAPTTSTYLSGYFYMCEKTKSSVACAMLDVESGSNTALEFSKYTIRPYFLILSMGFTALTTASLWVALALPCEKAWRLLSQGSLPMLAVSWLFALVASVWQEVAAHSAVRLASATKGSRASGCLWTAAAFLTLSMLLEFAMFIHVRNKRMAEEELGEKSSVKSANSHPWSTPAISSPMAAYKHTNPLSARPGLGTFSRM